MHWQKIGSFFYLTNKNCNQIFENATSCVFSGHRLGIELMNSMIVNALESFQKSLDKWSDSVGTCQVRNELEIHTLSKNESNEGFGHAINRTRTHTSHHVTTYSYTSDTRINLMLHA